MRDRVIQELVKGKEIASQLKTLIQNPVQGHDPIELALQLSKSFTEIISVMNSCDSVEFGGGSSCDSVDSKKKVRSSKERRGCYKRRRTSDSWITMSQTVEDGWAWRKYGQKDILNNQYPRCYFRCTNKSDGCKAMKQVQKTEDEPSSYQTTYFNHHTCTDSPRFTLESDPMERNLLCFQSSTHAKIVSSTIKKEDSITIKEETSPQDTQSEESSLENPWLDILNDVESIGYKPSWAPIIDSTSFHGLDMEVNQLEDLEIFHFDENYS